MTERVNPFDAVVPDTSVRANPFDALTSDQPPPSKEEPESPWLGLTTASGQMGMGKLGQNVKEFVTTPSKVGRLASQMVGAAAGGIVGGAGTAGVGAMAGGALGYAAGDQLADIIWGERPVKGTLAEIPGQMIIPEPKTSGQKVAREAIDQLSQGLEDVGIGGLYELGGKGMEVGGKALYAAPSAGQVWKWATSPDKWAKFKASGDALLNRYAQKQAGKKLVESTSHPAMGSATEKQFEANAAEASRLEKDIPGMEFNIGQRTGDPNLLSVARAKAQEPGAGSLANLEEVQAQNNAIYRYIEDHLRRNGDIKDFLSEVEKVKSGLAGESQKATQAAETQATKFTGRPPEEVGAPLLEKARKSQRAMSAEAKKLYDAIPEDMLIDSQPIWDTINKMYGSFEGLVERLGSMPTGTMARVKKLIKPQPTGLIDAAGNPIMSAVPTEMTMRQIKEFRSALSDLERGAIAGGDYKLAYNAARIKDSTNEALRITSQQEGKGAGIDALRKATAFWRDKYVPTFRHGATAKILGIRKSGEQAVSDSMIAQQYFTSGPRAGEVAANFKAVFGSDAEAKQLIRDYAAQDLLRAARNPQTGELSMHNVQRWIYNHNTALDAYGLKAEFGTLESATQVMNQAKAVEKEFNRSYLSKMLGVDSGKAIETALFTGAGRKESIVRLRKMAELASKDKSGRATEALQAGIGDFIQNNIQKVEVDLTGKGLASFAKYQKWYNDFRGTLEASGIYTQRQMDALKDIHQALTVISRQERPAPGYSGSATADLLTRAAASGTSFVIGRLGTYGTAHRLYQLASGELTQRINMALTQAVHDPRYAEALVSLASKINKTPAQQAVQAFNRRLAVLGEIAGTESLTSEESNSSRGE